MKHWFLMIVSAALIVLACKSRDSGPTQPEYKEVTFAWLTTSGNRIVNEDGDAVVLRGVNRSGLEYDKKGRGLSETDIRFICQEWKAQIIRLPFNQDWVTNDQTYLAFMDRVISWINKWGAYALLDLQWESVEANIPPIPNMAAVLMWQTLAGRYKDNPGVLYDIHNEAHNTSWDAWRSRASRIIEAIQTVHPGALIFVCGLDWAYDLRGWQADPLPYDNIVYSTHPYPFKGEPWAWDKYFGTFAERHPVFAGEFGGGEDDLEWGRQLLAYFDEKEMGWTAWSWVDSPQLTQEDRRTPTAFGELVKNALGAHAAGE